MNPSVIERHWQKRADRAALSTLTAHHFDAQREFYRPRKKSLRAALCSRRAGKTRGGNESDVELAAQTRDGRFLSVNETRAEAKRLAWHGARGDGMMSLVRDLGWIDSGRAVPNESELTIRFPAINSWIFLIGVDDERARGGNRQGISRNGSLAGAGRVDGEDHRVSRAATGGAQRDGESRSVHDRRGGLGERDSLRSA